MDAVLQRLKTLEGVTDSLLCLLAQQNPTLLQLELLTSSAAIQTFVNHNSGRGPAVLQQLDDETLAQYASLEPSETQMRILCSPGAVQAFIQNKIRPGTEAEKNAVGNLQEHVHPAIPCYSFTRQERGFLCEVWVNDLVSSASGVCKRTAKQTAAASMLHMIRGAA